MAVTSMVVGATTASGATFVVRVDGGGPVQVAVADNASMDGAVFFGPVAVDGQGVAKVAASGLAAGIGHWWQAFDDGDGSVSAAGRFRTHPPLGFAASFTVAVAGDAGLTAVFPGSGSELIPDRISNHPVHDTIRSEALAGDWLMFLHVGDLHYYDLGSGLHGVAGGGSLANYRRGYDDILLQSNQAALYRDVAWHYQWDDHDYGPNNSDGTLPDKGNALQVYGERAPHRALDGSNGIYQSWQIGRVLFVALDCRFNRSPNTDPQSPSKTMLGSAQKAWLDDLLATSPAQALVVLSSSPWTGTAQDTWAGFTHERDELAAMFGDHGWLGRMVMCYGDKHALGLDSGGTNPYGGFPLLQAASLDASPSASSATGRFDIIPDTPGRAQWGTITVQDLGNVLTIRLAGWKDTTEVGAYTLGIEQPQPTAPGALLRSLSGSHKATFEARILSTFQSGDDPAGTAIPILGGDVQMDATAQIQRILELETSGTVEGDSRRSIFPRRATDVLAPYGTEVFVRRGVDVGSTVLWVPLGYYRIDAVEQDDSPFGPIRLSCSDRMAGIVDARPLQPREFQRTRTVASVFVELVGEVYPDAVVIFDDDSGAANVGRVLVMEDSRYAVLQEVATSLGKIMFWDGNGLLRVMTAPAEETPVWEVKAGFHGVLVTAGRRVTRDGVYNAVVATGEGSESDVAPVLGIAVDNGPNSPTRWGGPFGRVPRFYSSPFITNVGQAENAARQLLRNSIGAPFAVDFGSIVNPSLQPYDPIRVTQQDGNRELHVVERLTIPLTADASMSGSTREKTLVVIGAQP